MNLYLKLMVFDGKLCHTSVITLSDVTEMIDLFTSDDILSFSICGIYRHSNIWLNFEVGKARKR